jgi:hypothetical protein
VKLRVRGSSIRLRLTRGEVQSLAGSPGVVSEQICFSPGVSLTYRVSRGLAPAVHASFDGNAIQITVPDTIAQRWAGSDEVGFEAEQANPGGAPLRILIEKDWNCLTPRAAEEDTDTFENPNKTC